MEKGAVAYVNIELFHCGLFFMKKIKIKYFPEITMGFPGGTSGKEPTCQCGRCKRHEFGPIVGKIPWKRAWQPTPLFFPGELHGQKNLESYSP